MIVWINGAFGAGKTQAASELHKRLPGSHLYDPENVGYFIRRTSPPALRQGDFQDIGLWRSINYELLLRLEREFGGIVIAPMTLVNEQYYHEIITRLRESGAEVRHCAPMATPETLRKRLKSRLERRGCWAEQQIDRCVAGLSSELFENKIATDNLSIDQVVEEIARVLHLELTPDRRGPLRRWLGRVHNQFRAMQQF